MDLSLIIDGIKLNVRVGIIFKHNDSVLIEMTRVKNGNSVLPGGRVKINELCIDAIKREIKEEMNFVLEDKKIIFRNNLEYFFVFNGEKYHEFFFVYEYLMDESDYNNLLNIKENMDNHASDYFFANFKDLKKFNLLPLEVIDIIKN